MSNVVKSLEQKKPWILILFAVVSGWFIYSAEGLPHFSNEYTLSIFGSIIQGMSALLSVALASIIFRIQTLENRRESIEESALGYILQITGITYPQWIPSVEADIENGTLTNRYYRHRLSQGQVTPQREEGLARDRNVQQERLMDVLNKRNNIVRAIRRVKRNFTISALILIAPILISLLMLLVPNAVSPQVSFLTVSMTVLLSTLGIVSLLYVVLEFIIVP